MLKYILFLLVAVGFVFFRGTLDTSTPINFGISVYEGVSDAEDAVKKKVIAGIKDSNAQSAPADQVNKNG